MNPLARAVLVVLFGLFASAVDAQTAPFRWPRATAAQVGLNPAVFDSIGAPSLPLRKMQERIIKAAR